jgi:hypothetical protein
MREDALVLPVCVTKGLVLTRRQGRRLTRLLCGNKMLVDLPAYIYISDTGVRRYADISRFLFYQLYSISWIVNIFSFDFQRTWNNVTLIIWGNQEPFSLSLFKVLQNTIHTSLIYIWILPILLSLYLSWSLEIKILCGFLNLIGAF